MMKGRVLLVEDDQTTQLVVKRMLEKLGYVVTGVAAGAVEALHAAEAERPDLFLVDIQLSSGADGIEVGEVFNDRFGLPVVFMTAHTDQDTVARATLTGPSGYLVKPVDELRLATALEIALFRHKMERELEERDVWTRSLIACLGEGVIATDAAGRVRFVNPSAAELLRTTPEAALSRSIGEVFRVAPGTAMTEGPIPSVLRTGEPVSDAAYGVIAGDRVRTVEASGRLIRDGSAATLGAVMVFRDVSERMRSDEAMRRTAKIQAVGTLASGVAHHFNNALQIMMGHAELMLTIVGKDDPIAVSAEAIRRTGKRANDLVKQLLMFSHADRPEPEAIPVQELADELVPLVKTVLPAHIRFRTPENVPDAAVEVTRKEFQQAVLALVDNARDAMPHGGELKLEIGARPRTDGGLGNEVFFAVVDTGKGLTPEVRAHLFEPFFTTKDPGQGTGLGLPSVFMTAQRMGGTVEVDSEPGRGATFRIVIPQAVIVEPHARASVPNPASADRGGKLLQLARGDETVLLVEDEQDVRQLIATALKNLGYSVLEAAGSKEALRILETHPGPLHMLLTDMVMPEMNGYELASRVERARPGIRVLFMSAYDEEFTQSYVGPTGAPVLHLKKPFRIETLAWKVRRTLSGE